MAGQAQKTRVQKKNNSPYFDERIVFNLSNLTRQALQEVTTARPLGLVCCPVLTVWLSHAQTTVTVNIYDKDFFGKQMIGSASFDLLSIYGQNDNHELFRAWVSLTDTEENNDEIGVQGYLRVSLMVRDFPAFPICSLA